MTNSSLGWDLPPKGAKQGGQATLRVACDNTMSDIAMKHLGNLEWGNVASGWSRWLVNETGFMAGEWGEHLSWILKAGNGSDLEKQRGRERRC